MSFPAPSPRMIPARWKGGAQTPRLIVIHSTVSPCKPGGAEAVARFFASEDNATSAHYVVDPSEVVQCVGDHTVAYHCGYNQDSIGVELCDRPTEENAKRWEDVNHKAMFDQAAVLVADLCLAYNIRPWFVNSIALRLGVRGVTTHAQMSQAFKKSTHWDPGAWPRKEFMQAVRANMRAKKATRR